MIKKLIIKIKPLYRALKYFKRKWIGVDDDERGISGKELQIVLDYSKEGGLFLEIGCSLGQTTKRLSEKGFVVGIDPYIIDERGLISGMYWEDMTRKFMESISLKNVCYFPMKSEDVKPIWEKLFKGEFDLIFVDGLHTYEQVKKDYDWLKHLKRDGYIIFHDTHFPKIDKFIQELPMKELELIKVEGGAKVFRRKQDE